MKQASVETTADAYLEMLAARGIEYFFGNGGSRDEGHAFRWRRACRFSSREHLALATLGKHGGQFRHVAGDLVRERREARFGLPVALQTAVGVGHFDLNESGEDGGVGLKIELQSHDEREG